MYKELLLVEPELFLNTSTALVGSSSTLVNSKYGSKIDSFQSVVRFNRAVTKKFEANVGSRTTLRVVNNHVFDNQDISKQGYTNSPKNFVKKLKNQPLLFQSLW